MKKKIILVLLAVAAGMVAAVVGVHVERIDYVYELNREMYIAEEDGLILVDTRAERPEYYTIKGTLPAGTKLQEAEKIAHRGFSFWWYLGPYSHVDVYGEILDGDFKGILVDFGEYRQCCPKHGYWYLCPLDCPDRNLKCLTPEKYDQEHILNSCGRRGKQ